ncbi:hypothetical protein ACFO0A_15155 [Novosphingobium tardum]|uniref:Uncharacterized protein n=1 Tax=Novosphingobium tardum TaxID=1538021 RepID=A0ABV8RU66_9SPHN
MSVSTTNDHRPPAAGLFGGYPAEVPPADAAGAEGKAGEAKAAPLASRAASFSELFLVTGPRRHA